MGRGSSGVKAKTYALFHGSASTDIEEFDIGRAGTNTSSGEKFLFFTDSKSAADEFSYERLEGSTKYTNKLGKKGKVYEVDVTMSKPLDFTNPTSKDVKNLIDMSGGLLTEKKVKDLSKNNNQLLKAYVDLNSMSKYGYDGFIATMDSKGTKEYAVVSSKQTKIKK